MLPFSEQQGRMQTAQQQQINDQNGTLLRLLQYSLSCKKKMKQNLYVAG